MIVINTAGGAIDNSNSGNISATTNNFISSGTLNNKNGKLAAGQMLAVNTNGNALTNTGKAKTAGIEAGVVALETGIFDNDNGQLYGGYVGMINTALSNNSGVIDAIGSVDVESSGNIDNVAGLIRSSSGSVKLKAAKTVKSNNNKSADLTGAESLGLFLVMA
jgi:adhesin HecA-like repeat protein